MKIHSWSNFIMGIILITAVVYRFFRWGGAGDFILVPILIYQAIRAFKLSTKKKEEVVNIS